MDFSVASFNVFDLLYLCVFDSFNKLQVPYTLAILPSVIFVLKLYFKELNFKIPSLRHAMNTNGFLTDSLTIPNVLLASAKSITNFLPSSFLTLNPLLTNLIDSDLPSKLVMVPFNIN